LNINAERRRAASRGRRKDEDIEMNLELVELLELDDDLGTFELLRKHIPSEQLYQVDRRAQLVAAIENMCDREVEDGWLVNEET
jgi:hypothetical protein